MGVLNIIKAAALAVVATAGASAASVVEYEINFDDPYPEFTLTGFKNGSTSPLSTPHNCGSLCLQLGNQESVKIELTSGGLFSLVSFLFDGKDGESDAIVVSTVLDGTGLEFGEPNNANTMTLAEPALSGLSAIYIRNNKNGTARLDDIKLSYTTPVPLPASGLFLAGGLGALALRRKRKSA